MVLALYAVAPRSGAEVVTLNGATWLTGEILPPDLQALRERKRLRHNAPHLVKILPFLLPVLKRDGLINRRVARAMGTAMWMYDVTGGWRIGKLHQRIDAVTANRLFPHVFTASLDGIQPEHYAPDGIHLSDLGMDFEASRLEQAIEGYFGESP